MQVNKKLNRSNKANMLCRRILITMNIDTASWY